MPTNPNEVKATVVSRNPNIQHPEGIQPLEVNKQEQKKQPAWKQGWEKIKNFRNNFKKENQNPQEPKNQNKLAQAIKEKFETIGDFNRLPVKEKALVFAIATTAILAIIASTAFLIPSGLSAAGYIGSYLGFTKGAITIGGVTLPALTSTLVGSTGTFGTYGYLGWLGTANLATTTAGMYGVQAGVGAAGAGLLAGGLKLANQGDKLIKNCLERLPPRQSKLGINPLEIENQKPVRSAKIENNLVNSNNPKENSKPISNSFKTRYENILTDTQLSDEQKKRVINQLITTIVLNSLGGTADKSLNEAIDFSLQTGNYEMWKDIYKEIARQTRVKESDFDLSPEMFKKIRSKK